MSKLRLVFVKEHQASYISHLDVMRTFQRVFPRAGLSIKHSNGCLLYTSDAADDYTRV